MPATMPYYDPADKALNDAAAKEMIARTRDIEERRRYYIGDHDSPLKVKPGERDDNIILNLCGDIIDKSVDFVGVPDFVFPEDVPDVARVILDELKWQTNLPYLVPDLMTSGMIAGHYYLRIIMPDRGEPSADNPPMLAILQPEYVTAFWDAGLFGTRQSAVWYRVSWTFGKVERRQDIVPVALVPDALRSEVTQPLTDDGWVILEYERAGAQNRREWELIAADSWAYPFAPIVDGKNRRRPHSYYGESELKDLRLNDAINFVASNTARILKFHAHPTTLLFGVTNMDQSTAVDRLWTIPNENARAENLEMQSDLQSSMNMLAMLRGSMFNAARVVDMATHKDKIGGLTNFGVRMLFNDMLAMAEEKRRRYGDALEESFERMMYMIVGEWVEIDTVWADPLPVNRAEVVQAVEREQAIGITSDHTLATELGREYDDEAELKRTEAADMIDLRVGTMASIAERGLFGVG